MTKGIHTVVALGVYRHVAESMGPLFAETPFQTAAILDLKQEPESVRYSPHNMATILYSLHPRPKVFITGAAISQEMTDESIKVWDEYVERTKQVDTLVINMYADPPPDGNWPKLILQRLADKYGAWEGMKDA